MGKISFGFAFASLLLTASADVYDASTGYVTLKIKELNGAITPFNVAEENEWWSDGLPPHGTTNYFVARGQTLSTPQKTTVNHAWQGGRLVSDGKIWLVSGTTITIPDLVCLGSSASFYTAGSPGPLCGQITIQGMASNPVVFYHNTGSKMILDAMMSGEDDSMFKFDKAYRNAEVFIRGDWSAFKGTLLLTRDQPNTDKQGVTTNGYYIETAAIAGKLKATSGATVDTKLVITNAVTVGALELDDGVELVFGGDVSAANALGCLTVTNSMTLNGKPRIVVGSIDADVATGYSHPLLQFKEKEGQELSLDDFEIVGGEIVNPLGQYQLKWEIGDSTTDGYKELRIVKTPPVGDLVRNIPDAVVGKGFSAFTDAQDPNGKYYWDDQGIPQAGNTYVASNKNLYVKGPKSSLPYEFPGAALYLVDTTFTSAGSATEAAGILANELYWCGGTVQVWGGGAKDTALHPSVVWFTIGGGRLFTYAGTTIKNTSFNGSGVKFASELIGGGTLELNVNNANKASGRKSYNALTGLNTNFIGRVLVTACSEPVVCPGDNLTAPSDDYCVSLMVTNGLALGGAVPSFTYDALILNRYGRLWISKRDVELADGLNRGVYINGIGRMEVGEGLTLSVAWPVTVNGTFRKQGAGTLALGGTMRFTDGGEETLPSADKNLVRIEGGVLRLDAAHALDGAAVTFVEGTKIVLKESATEDELAVKGLVNVKGDFVAARVASEATDGAIAVDIDASGCATAESATFGLFTVPTEAEATALKAKVSAPRRVAVGDKNLSLSGALAVAQNADGTWTVSAKYEVHGLLLLVR